MKFKKGDRVIVRFTGEVCHITNSGIDYSYVKIIITPVLEHMAYSYIKCKYTAYYNEDLSHHPKKIEDLL